MGHGQLEDAPAAYQTAMELAPEIAELKAWAAIAMVQMDQEREASNAAVPDGVSGRPGCGQNAVARRTPLSGVSGPDLAGLDCHPGARAGNSLLAGAPR